MSLESSLDSIRDPVTDCMYYLFEFENALRCGEVSISELIEVMELSIADGHDAMLIALAMASLALEKVKEKHLKALSEAKNES